MTLNRPDKRNTLHTEPFQQLDVELAELEAQRQFIGCVILRTNHPFFTAGADLQDTTRVARTFKQEIIGKSPLKPETIDTNIEKCLSLFF